MIFSFTKPILTLTFIVGLTLISCKKEGCLDSDAKNYNADAKTDDGSCTYEAQFVVYFNQATSENLIADGISELSFYLGGKSIGSLSTSNFSVLLPECGGSEGLTTTVDLGSVKSSYELELRYLNSANGDVIASGSYPGIHGGECRQYEITY
ncbi:MAG: hypothetical protein IT222_08465 [Crocinitomix sp.]|nr:hypothetical protein [Crocinitomix sp.]